MDAQPTPSMKDLLRRHTPTSTMQRQLRRQLQRRQQGHGEQPGQGQEQDQGQMPQPLSSAQQRTPQRQWQGKGRHMRAQQPEQQRQQPPLPLAPPWNVRSILTPFRRHADLPAYAAGLCHGVRHRLSARQGRVDPRETEPSAPACPQSLPSCTFFINPLDSSPQITTQVTRLADRIRQYTAVCIATHVARPDTCCCQPSQISLRSSPLTTTP